MDRRNFMKTAGMAGMAIPLTNISLANAKENTEMPICIFSKHLQFLNYEEAAEAAKAIGFDGMDLTVRRGGHVKPENVERDLPVAVNAFKKAGLQVPMMATNVNNAEEDIHLRVLKAASKEGIRFYRMGYLSYTDQPIPGTLEKYGQQLQRLAEVNDDLQMTGMYQNHAGGRVGGPVWDVWYMIKDLNPNQIGVQYDVRHATVEGGYSWPRGMELLKPWIGNLVFKDFKWEKNDKGDWRAVSVPLGEGMVDWPKYFQLLKEWNVRGPVSVHYEYPVLTGKEKEMSKSKKTERTIEVMRKDLLTLRGWFEKYRM